MTFPHVYIAQLLCPQRHCVLALCLECESQADADELGVLLQAHFDAMVEKRVLNRECGICKSTDLRVEVARTKWAKRAQAELHLKRLEREQTTAREYILHEKARRN